MTTSTPTGTPSEPDSGEASAPWECLATWSQAERDWWHMGPFNGGAPGMVRRIRRILDVSQRGLAAILGVSQSVVARWETGRTSPRVEVMERLMRLAKLHATIHDDETGEQVTPMREDGARKHGGSRYPAHADLRVTGWWVPKELRSMTTVDYFRWIDRSRARQDPSIRYRTDRRVKLIWREIDGTPDDHPALHQLVAEAVHLDERREERRRSGGDTPPQPPMRRHGPGGTPPTSLTA